MLCFACVGVNMFPTEFKIPHMFIYCMCLAVNTKAYFNNAT